MKTTAVAFLSFLGLAACSPVIANSEMTDSEVKHLNKRTTVQCNISTPLYNGKADAEAIGAGDDYVLQNVGTVTFNPNTINQVYCSNNSGIFVANDLSSPVAIDGLRIAVSGDNILKACSDANGSVNGKDVADVYSVIVASSTC